jgi:NAD(P)-dependent dehydrogenase (short-subunit alcohol dehydrogenase family)
MTSTSSSPSTALVTGATSGIGRATAIALAASGIHVAVSGRDKARGDLTVAEIRAAGGQADFVPADLRDAASATQLAGAAEAVLGHVDILVNNAGSGAFGPTADTTEAAFDELFALNVKAPYFLTAALAPGMAERGAGVIVNVSTMVAEFDQGVGGGVRAQGHPCQRCRPGAGQHRGHRRHAGSAGIPGLARAGQANGHRAGDRRGHRLPGLTGGGVHPGGRAPGGRRQGRGLKQVGNYARRG